MRSVEFFETHPIFSRREYVDARSLHGSTEHTSDNLLAQHLASGRIIRVRRGLFASVPSGIKPTQLSVDPYLIATKLAPDAVVSHHAALQFHGKVYSLWSRLHYLSRHRGRRFSFRGQEFVPVKLPPSLIGIPDNDAGVIQQRYSGGTVRVTTLERTLVDVMYAPDKTGDWEEIWRSLEMIGFVDLELVIKYTRALGSALCAARIGFFLEQHQEEFMVDNHHLDVLRQLSPRQARYMDSRHEAGRLIKGWNLVVPERVIRRAWQEVL